MKTKKLSKKLLLNRETVAKLNAENMKLVKGGNTLITAIDPTICETTTTYPG
jgi:natural product precursor